MKTVSNEAIKHELFDLASVKIALLVLKYIFNPDTLEKSLSEFFEVGRAYFEDAKGLIFLETVIKYIYKSSDISEEKMATALKSVSPKGGGLAVSTAQKLIREGMQQGIQQGMQKGKRELIYKMYSKGMSIHEIADLTEMDVKDIRKIVSEP